MKSWFLFSCVGVGVIVRQAIDGNDKSELRRLGVLGFYKWIVSFGGPRAATIYSEYCLLLCRRILQ